MKPCLYCAQTTTKKDSFGYCKRYKCFERSGKNIIFQKLIKSASDICTMPNTYGQISGPVTNSYKHRTRKANEIFHEAQREFGFLPLEILEAVPLENRKRWDKNIRW